MSEFLGHYRAKCFVKLRYRLAAFFEHITNSLWFSGLAVDRLRSDLPYNRPIPKKADEES
jgi:hypothetical protein